MDAAQLKYCSLIGLLLLPVAFASPLLALLIIQLSLFPVVLTASPCPAAASLNVLLESLILPAPRHVRFSLTGAHLVRLYDPCMRLGSGVKDHRHFGESF